DGLVQPGSAVVLDWPKRVLDRLIPNP
ncbi:alpha-ribazole phosphatase, partial [Thermus scotoductus]